MRLRPPVFLARLRRAAGRVRRAGRSMVDGLLHPPRRRRALERVGKLTERETGTVLFVCLGNVCRSPYAEARFASEVKARSGGWAARSAGFIGPGRTTPPEAQDAAAARGLDTGAHRSRLLTTEALVNADLVVVMDGGQERRIRRHGVAVPVIVLGDLDPETVTRRGIRDPWGHDPELFRSVFHRIDRCVEVLVGILERPAGAPESSGDGPRDFPMSASPVSNARLR